MGIGIVGTGAYLPPGTVTNAQMAEVIDTSNEWIVDHTGICQRRFVEEGVATSDLATSAAAAAMKSAGISPEEIGLIVLATSSPDWIQPATACAVQHNLGLTRAAAFDISAVCCGFVYGLTVGSAMLSSRPAYRHVLVIGAEAYSKFLDWRDRQSCVFFGDGAGAVVLREVPAEHGILSTRLLADGAGTDIVGIPAGGSRLPASLETVGQRQHYFRMQGRRVWQYALHAFPLVIREAVSEAGLELQDVDLFIFHQSNAVMIDAVMRSMGVDREQTFLTVHKYGNTAAASIPITLHEAVEQGRIRPGQIVVLAAVGGGMTAGATVMRWV